MTRPFRAIGGGREGVRLSAVSLARWSPIQGRPPTMLAPSAMAGPRVRPRRRVSVMTFGRWATARGLRIRRGAGQAGTLGARTGGNAQGDLPYPGTPRNARLEG